jgi:uncharacterized tellurite resistance protein B-like protein
MWQSLSTDDRLLLIEVVCAFAWTDLEVKQAERRFVERLMDRLELDGDERRQAKLWLDMAPAAGAADPKRIPKEHRRLFLESVRALIYSDGQVDDEERERFAALQKALEES